MDDWLVLLTVLLVTFLMTMTWSLRRPSPHRAKLLGRLTAAHSFTLILVIGVAEGKSGYRLAMCAAAAIASGYLALREWQQIRRVEAT